MVTAFRERDDVIQLVNCGIELRPRFLFEAGDNLTPNRRGNVPRSAGGAYENEHRNEKAGEHGIERIEALLARNRAAEVRNNNEREFHLGKKPQLEANDLAAVGHGAEEDGREERHKDKCCQGPRHMDGSIVVPPGVACQEREAA